MRGRLLIGAAALLGAMGLASEANAACNEYRNEARRPTTELARVEELLRLASRECTLSVINDIQARRDELSGQKPIADPPPPNGTNPPPPPPPPQNNTRIAFRPLAVGQNASGALTNDSQVDPAGIPYEMWSFPAQAGQRLQVSMTATQGSALDTYLVVGRMRAGSFEELASNDDRGNGTLNSMVVFVPEATGDYAIRARSYSPQSRGAYELLVEPVVRAAAVARPLTLGESIVATLGPSSPFDLEGGYSYELWSFQATAGQRLQLSMSSYNFDPYLAVGRMSGGRFVEIANNDDRGDGTLNSLLRFTPAESGEYTIRARTYNGEQAQDGSYQLLVQPTAPVTASVPVAPRANSWVLQGEFTSEGEANFTDFQFEAVRGRRYSVRAISNDFTPIVDIGIADDSGQLREVSFFGSSDRAMNTAEFSAEQRGRYIVRVSAPALSSGHFDLIVNEVR